MTLLEDNFVTTRIIAFERYNFICRKQKKNESLEQFHADLVELASRADCGDREDERVRDMFTANMHNEKVKEELLAEPRSHQDVFEYAIRREKGIEHSQATKTNPFRGPSTTPLKQEPVLYINLRGRGNYTNNQYPPRGRGGFHGRPYGTGGTQNTRGQQQQSHYNLQKKQCYKYGRQFGTNHLQSRQANAKLRQTGPFCKSM